MNIVKTNPGVLTNINKFRVDYTRVCNNEKRKYRIVLK
jgi:hypothetical protein